LGRLGRGGVSQAGEGVSRQVHAQLLTASSEPAGSARERRPILTRPDDTPDISMMEADRPINIYRMWTAQARHGVAALSETRCSGPAFTVQLRRNPSSGALHLIPRPLGRASPLGRVPRVPAVPLPPLAAPLVDVDPLVLVEGAGTRDWRFEAGVWYLSEDLVEVGGFSTKEVSVVLGLVSLVVSVVGLGCAHECSLGIDFASHPLGHRRI
jgi:hypothetical protein